MAGGIQLLLPLSLLLLATHPGGAIRQVRPVQIGGCYDASSDGLLHCAAVEDDCSDEPGTRFKSAEQLGFAGLEACAAATLSAGMCLGEEGRSGDGGPVCALTEHACSNPGLFVPADYSGDVDVDVGDRCTARGRADGRGGDGEKTLLPTLYGACRDGTTGAVTCLLSPSDCPDRAAWIPADVVLLHRPGGCRCGDVRVGLCQNFGHGGGGVMNVKCAIGPDDCEFTEHVPPIDAAGHPSMVDCRLCPADDPGSYGPVASYGGSASYGGDGGGDGSGRGNSDGSGGGNGDGSGGGTYGGDDGGDGSGGGNGDGNGGGSAPEDADIMIEDELAPEPALTGPADEPVEPTTAAPAAPASDADPTPTDPVAESSPPTKEGTASGGTSSLSALSSSEDASGTNAGGVVIIVVGSVLGFFAVLAVTVAAVRFRRRQRSKVLKEAEPPLPLVI